MSAHARRPVFAVTGNDDQPSRCQNGRSRIEIDVGGIGEIVPLPFDEVEKVDVIRQEISAAHAQIERTIEGSSEGMRPRPIRAAIHVQARPAP